MKYVPPVIIQVPIEGEYIGHVDSGSFKGDSLYLHFSADGSVQGYIYEATLPNFTTKMVLIGWYNKYSRGIFFRGGHWMRISGHALKGPSIQIIGKEESFVSFPGHRPQEFRAILQELS